MHPTDIPDFSTGSPFTVLFIIAFLAFTPAVVYAHKIPRLRFLSDFPYPFVVFFSLVFLIAAGFSWQDSARDDLQRCLEYYDMQNQHCLQLDGVQKRRSDTAFFIGILAIFLAPGYLGLCLLPKLAFNLKEALTKSGENQLSLLKVIFIILACFAPVLLVLFF